MTSKTIVSLFLSYLSATLPCIAMNGAGPSGSGMKRSDTIDLLAAVAHSHKKPGSVSTLQPSKTHANLNAFLAGEDYSSNDEPEGDELQTPASSFEERRMHAPTNTPLNTARSRGNSKAEEQPQPSRPLQRQHRLLTVAHRDKGCSASLAQRRTPELQFAAYVERKRKRSKSADGRLQNTEE